MSVLFGRCALSHRRSRIQCNDSGKGSSSPVQQRVVELFRHRSLHQTVAPHPSLTSRSRCLATDFDCGLQPFSPDCLDVALLSSSLAVCLSERRRRHQLQRLHVLLPVSLQPDLSLAAGVSPNASPRQRHAHALLPQRAAWSAQQLSWRASTGARAYRRSRGVVGHQLACGVAAAAAAL